MKTFKKIIFDDLKSQSLGHLIPFITSVKLNKYAGGSSLRVCTMDLLKTDREKLKSFIDEYKHGDFDGMTDLYTYRQTTKERTAKYVFLTNSFSQSTRDEVINYLKNEWNIIDDASAQEKMNCCYDQVVHRILVDIVSLSPLKIG